METKTCFECHRNLPLEEFYRNSGMKGGRVNKCKDCTCRGVRENRAKKADYYREYERKRAKRPERREAQNRRYREERRRDPERFRGYRKKYYEANKEAVMERQRKARESEPLKYRARCAVNNAVRDGRLKREPCERCGSKKKVHGHHDDYSKPLDVRWLCASCHQREHEKEATMTTPQHEWTPRQAELLALARERGPWAETRYGKIRNAEGCCPLEAALGLPERSYGGVISQSLLSDDERVGVAGAADMANSYLRPALRAALGMPEVG